MYGERFGTGIFLRVATSVLHLLMTPLMAGQSKYRVDAVPRGAAGRFRQDDVLTVLRGRVDELLRIHRRGRSFVGERRGREGGR